MPGEGLVELPISGMDCADCTEHVRQAISALPGVTAVTVFLAAEKAIVRYDPTLVDLPAMRRAVASAGYAVPSSGVSRPGLSPLTDFTRRVLTLFGLVFGVVLFVVIVGEWFGVFQVSIDLVPWPMGWAIVLGAGYPVLRDVFLSTLKRQITSHTLMTVGVLAALAVGQWPTAVVVVFFMRIGDYAERFTTARARRAVKDLTAAAPQAARVVRDGAEVMVPVEDVRVGETVVVRPGEQIPVDGEVLAGQATVEQAAITGESMPVEAEPGSRVFAATFARLGSLRVRVTQVGPDTTFGRVIRMVEEAESHRAGVQRIADRFSAYFLPVVATTAALTLLLRRDPLSAAAVLVVACSCSFALATPIAMLASIGAGAKRGLLIKGGKYLEALARADVLLIDKTGTLTLGKLQITDVLPLNGVSGDDILALAATAERYSEHPLAAAVRTAAVARGLTLGEPEQFVTLPGLGLRARVDGAAIAVGSRRILRTPPAADLTGGLAGQGKTLLYVVRDDDLLGIMAAADTIRPEVPAALAAVRQLGIKEIILTTGDNALTAAAVAGELGIAFRADLLPEDKIAIVRDYQSRGHVVVMVGDGVNDAPALAQADVGIAMGAAGSDVAIEAAHIALMRDDWTLVPEALRIAQRTMRVVKMNLAFTVVYNVVGLTLAALGFLPPILAAAVQSLPDLGILANSSRLLRGR